MRVKLDKRSIIKEKSLTFYIETYGCQMNLSDSNDMRKLLLNNGFVESINSSDANIVVINTCSVRATAEQRIIGRLSHYKKEKKSKDFVILLTGCMAERLSEKLLKDFPELDIIVGTHFKSELDSIIKSFISSHQRKSYSGFEGYKFINSYEDKILNFKAFIPIIHGCDNFCSYCIVPYTRGRQISRQSEEIIQNVQMLVDKGVIEITLLGQNVNSYGQDNNDISFAQLLQELSKMNGLERIRFITSHPKDISKELIHTIAENRKICKYIHLPFQSASNRVLADMNRGYTFEYYTETINYMKKIINNISLSTDVLVGYPTESENDYEMTVKAIKEIEFDTAFMFKYSIREGTSSSKLNDSIPEEEKIRRLQNIISIQNKITKKKNKEKIGTIEEILFESISKSNSTELLGKTDSFNDVVAEGDRSLIGKIKKVKITDLKGYTLKGQIID